MIGHATRVYLVLEVAERMDVGCLQIACTFDEPSKLEQQPPLRATGPCSWGFCPPSPFVEHPIGGTKSTASTVEQMQDAAACCFLASRNGTPWGM